MPNVMALPNIGGALYGSSVIPFLVPRRKVWLAPAAGVPCSNAGNIRERKAWTQSEFFTCQNSARREGTKEMREGGEVERLYAKFHLNVFIVSASGGQKPQFWANFDILGAPVPTPFYR